MKHDNYNKTENIKLVRMAEDTFQITYESENYTLVGGAEDILNELAGHMDLMNF